MDFKNLKQQIKQATEKAFLEMFEKHGHEEIYAFALYSDEDAITVCPSTNTLENLKNIESDYLIEYKFETAEWIYEGQGARKEFNDICTLLSNEVLDGDASKNTEWHDDFKSTLFTTCIEVLEELKEEKFFNKIIGKDIFLTFSVSDYDFKKEDLKEIIKKLNDNPYKDEYLKWMETWAE